MRVFHLPDIIYMAMKIKHVLLLDQSACFFMIGPWSWPRTLFTCYHLIGL